jgi:ABC-type lipoprotein release transport system permease subunit
MSLPFSIARRYFFSRRSGGSFNLITIISAISLLGYAVGTAALIVVLSVFNGFEELFVSMYNDFDADIRITSPEGKAFEESTLDWQVITGTAGVLHYSRVLEEKGILAYDERQNIAKIKGVDEQYRLVTSLDSAIVAGFMVLEEGDTNFAVVGQGVAYQLSIDPSDYFRRLTISIPNRKSDDVLDASAALLKATINPVGIFSVQEEVDNQYVVVPLRFLRKLVERDSSISAVDIKLAEGTDMEEVKQALQKKLGKQFVVLNRFEQREAFFKIMKSEKLVSYFILLFILLVASGNAIGSLYILVIEKTRDLRILASMGMQPDSATAIFRYESLLISLTGAAIGIVLGVGLCLLQQQYGFVRLEGAANFAFTAYPVTLNLRDVALVVVTVIFLGWLTSLYPASKARALFGA